jgi:hypothetical protein
MLLRLDAGVYQCDVCELLAVDLSMVEYEVVRDGVSYGTDPLAVPCDNGCDDHDEWIDL